MERRFRERTIHFNNLPSYSTTVNQHLQNNTEVNIDGININWMDISGLNVKNIFDILTIENTIRYK